MNHPLEADRTYALHEAYAHCEAIARAHYENFPVGSVLVPKRLRKHFYSVYAYSRGADDIADEGDRTAEERIAALDAWEAMLDQAYNGSARHPVFVALGATVRELNIPSEPFRDLLRAFRLDAHNRGYETMDDLLAYCRWSADPVGRLVLHLFGLATPDRLPLSDAICTALQLANFWQDVSVDLPRGRANIPRAVLRQFGCTELDLRAPSANPQVRAMMAHLVADAQERFAYGRRLLGSVPVWRLRMELRLVVLGGERVLAKIRSQHYDVLAVRPSLGLLDKLRMAARLVIP